MSQPLTRDIQEVVGALEIVLAELRFHCTRLDDKLRVPRTFTDEEADHLEDLVRGYQTSQHYLDTLLRYQRGRLTRQRLSLPAGVDIDAAGRGRAHITDEDAPT